MSGARWRSRSRLLCLLLVVLLTGAPAAWPQNATTRSDDIERLLMLLSEQNQELEELQTMWESRSIGLAQLTQLLEQSRTLLSERERELARIENSIEDYRSESSLLRQQLQQARQELAELSNVVERLRNLLDESYQAEIQLIEQLESAQVRIRRTRILAVGGVVTAFVAGAITYSILVP